MKRTCFLCGALRDEAEMRIVSFLKDSFFVCSASCQERVIIIDDETRAEEQKERLHDLWKYEY